MPTSSAVTIQTASLWSLAAGDIFSGTGGPQAYDPFFGQFSDVVTSDGIDAEPYSDQLWNIPAGDDIVFVIAVQNRSGAPVYDVSLQNLLPAGFVPDDGTGDVSVTDGNGNALNFTGNLFDPNTGLQITDPLDAYDRQSGTNLALITFSASTRTAIPVPNATLASTAELTGYALSSGGPNALTQILAANAQLGSGYISVSTTPEQSIDTLYPGNTAAYDITVQLPAGTAQDLRIDEMLPNSGTAWFNLVSAQIVSTGANIQTSITPVVGADGSISFGNVTDSGTSTDAGADEITVRITVGRGGTTAGIGTLQTVVSTADPNSAGARWSDTLTNTLGLAPPNTPPAIAGTTSQTALDTVQVFPLAGLLLTDPDVGQTETLTIRPLQPGLASLTGPGLQSVDGGATYTLTGTVAQVQAAARQVALYSGAGRSGTETLSLTLTDSAGARAMDVNTQVTFTLPPVNTSPTISGTAPSTTLDTVAIQPFAGVTLTDPDAGQTETLTIHLSDPYLTFLTGPGLATANGTDYLLSGSIAQVQAALRQVSVSSTSGQSGQETLSLSLSDGAGGLATDANTVITVTAPPPPPTVTVPPPPDVPPTISGTKDGQNATATMQIRPFASIALADPDIGQTETLTIHLSNPGIGVLTGAGVTTNQAGDYVLSGMVDQVQAAARTLLFASTYGATGAEQMTLTLNDGAGGVATDTTTALTISAPAASASTIQHFPLASSGSVLTSTASGGQTVAQVETYAGPVSYLQSQFIYDGTDPLAIVAQAPNMFIKSAAGSAAIHLLAGQNVVDAGHGSNFLIGGTGTDVFFLDARQPVQTWDTIIGFHTGDIVTLWGFQDGTSQYHWDDAAGVGTYTGRTLRADIAGNGTTDASITFAGTTAADTAHYSVTTGTVGGTPYMTIFAL